MSHYLAINDYRNHSGDGFGNTWSVWQCRSRDEQLHILRQGLPCGGLVDSEKRLPRFTTCGIRLATRAEIRQALKDGLYEHEPIPFVHERYCLTREEQEEEQRRQLLLDDQEEQATRRAEHEEMLKQSTTQHAYGSPKRQ
jgi:hypothetical protein